MLLTFPEMVTFSAALMLAPLHTVIKKVTITILRSPEHSLIILSTAVNEKATYFVPLKGIFAWTLTRSSEHILVVLNTLNHLAAPLLMHLKA